MANRPERPLASEEKGTTLVSIIQRALPVTVRGGLSAVIAIAGGVALFLGFILLLFIQELRGYAYTVLAVGGILLLAAFMISFATVWEAITGRRGRYGANTLVMIAAFLALAILVYALAARNAGRWDITYTGQFSLAPQTLEILKNLEENVQATAFFVPGVAGQEEYRVPAENLLDEFERRSASKFSSSSINPDLQPSLAYKYNVTEYPTIVFEGEESGLRIRLTAPLFQERDFTSAVLIVTGEKRKMIYALEGHRERDLGDRTDGSHQGFGFAAEGLFRDNYDVLPLSLYALEKPYIATTGEDAVASVIIAGPSQDLIEKEIQALVDYLKRGGRLLLLLEPNPPQTYKDLLARWAITVNNGIVIDEASNVAGERQTPLIAKEQYFKTPPIDAITKPLDQSYFPGTASFQPSLPQDEMPDYIVHYPLARTTLLSCLTTDPEVSECPREGFDIRFPALALQATSPLNEEPAPNATRETRIVVFGDTDFATNYHFYEVSNGDLFLNSVNWLTEDIALADVRAKSIALRRLVVTGRQLQLIRGLSWFVLPAAMALLAGVAWWRQR